MAEVFSPSSIERMMYPKLYSDSKDSKALFFSIIPLAATAALKCPHLPQARYVVCSCRILRTQTPLVRLQPPELHEEEAVEELFWVLVLGLGSGFTVLGFRVYGIGFRVLRHLCIPWFWDLPAHQHAQLAPAVGIWQVPSPGSLQTLLSHLRL